MTIGAVVISRNDGYGGDTAQKAIRCLTSLIHALDEVIYVDWNSPGDVSLMQAMRPSLPRTGKLRAIQITEARHRDIVGADEDVQKCVEVLARNIGIRRLSTDYIISANADVMCLDRASIESQIINNRTFHCVARRETPFRVVLEAEDPAQFLRDNIAMFGQHGDGSPLGAVDRWSLINCPGDFQIAHRDVWHAIRAFEEHMIRRGYADSNVQRKADFYGFDLKLVRDIPVFHFQHYADTGSCGGAFGGWNDRLSSIEEFAGTRNSEAWGMRDIELKEEVI